LINEDHNNWSDFKGVHEIMWQGVEGPSDAEFLVQDMFINYQDQFQGSGSDYCGTFNIASSITLSRTNIEKAIPFELVYSNTCSRKAYSAYVAFEVDDQTGIPYVRIKNNNIPDPNPSFYRKLALDFQAQHKQLYLKNDETKIYFWCDMPVRKKIFYGFGYKINNPQNVVTENSPLAGDKGGWCQCPDGQVYQAGELVATPGTMACINGKAGALKEDPGAWSKWYVECKNSITTTEHEDDVGENGGSCTCPDGTVHKAGTLDYSLACDGGVASEIIYTGAGDHSHKRVTCMYKDWFVQKGIIIDGRIVKSVSSYLDNDEYNIEKLDICELTNISKNDQD
jgi:hypothetical protein